MKEKKYIGRYAPSPTGRLHLGNLRTALIAWLHARLNAGQFLLRMDDLDTPRVVAGSDSQIIRDLEWLGVEWDGAVMYQSKCLDKYRSLLDSLKQEELVYPCFCSRKDIQQAASAPHGKPVIYLGTCRNLSRSEVLRNTNIRSPAWRFNVSRTQSMVHFHDGIQGEVAENILTECGDFVVRRTDNLFAYQLAVVVDDFNQSVTDIVRGNDLLHSTARQIVLFKTLFPEAIPPKYWHIDLMLDETGQRLSKRDGSDSIEQWKSKTPETLIGFLAYSIGLLKDSSPIALDELLQSLTLNRFYRLLKPD